MLQQDDINDNRIVTWQEGRARTVTFIVTEDCQLRCKYCYLVGKNSARKMDFEVARATVDYLLRERAMFNSKSIIFDFIGGEPLLEIDLIDRICDYIKLRMFEVDHPLVQLLPLQLFDQRPSLREEGGSALHRQEPPSHQHRHQHRRHEAQARCPARLSRRARFVRPRGPEHPALA